MEITDLQIVELAAQLTTLSEAECDVWLREHPALARRELAYALKDLCLVDGWNDDPTRCLRAAATAALLAQQSQDDEITALAGWCAGVAAIVGGRIEIALSELEKANARFQRLGLPHTAAETQIVKLYALALLGRYDEAITCGLRAREVFLNHDDQLGAGRVEQNIGNIYFRRDLYHKAEHFQSSARERFLSLNNQVRLARADNCLANTRALLHQFRSATALYEEALQAAAAAGLTATQAEIEGNMGNMALLQGNYDRALDLLERARRKYAALDMPHQSATAELEIADAYLELNLLPEASAIYERVAPLFAGLGMRAEEARAFAQHGRAAARLGRNEQAHKLLAQALALYEAEGNAVGAAQVTLAEAQIHYAEGHWEATCRAAQEAETPLEQAGSWRHWLAARWLRGDTARLQGRLESARVFLHETLRAAAEKALPQVAERCHTSLGLLAERAGNQRAARAAYRQAVKIIENLRAPLPSEEFRAAYFADKLAPYYGLARLRLAAGDEQSHAQAFEIIERARARALADTLAQGLAPVTEAKDAFTVQTRARLAELRTELNWFYSRINRPGASDAARLAELHEEARTREHEMLELMRQLHQRGSVSASATEAVRLAEIQPALGPDSALVEFVYLDGECLAFVITATEITVVRDLGTAEETRAALAHFHLQLRSLRYGAAVQAHRPQMAARARVHLRRLYDLLLARIEPLIGARRLVVVPHGVLHYVPFQALHDGQSYLIERREVVVAPSAWVLRHCLNQPQHAYRAATLLGVPDERTPRVSDEIDALAPLFTEARVLLGPPATLEALRRHAPAADVLHLACHGQFRPDNPLFSALHLADGWLTVRDAYQLELARCRLVTLSACETGLSAVAPGDELTGLARGFFSAGVPSLLLSLWMVDDGTTAELMSGFYARLLQGAGPAAALRAAQCALIEKNCHPFYWAALTLYGRG